MKSLRTEKFRQQLANLPVSTQRKFDKQLRFLIADLRHPSLRAKKYDESQGIWQARVDDHYRFYFIIDGNAYVLFNILSHAD